MKLFYQSNANLPGIYKILNTHTNRIYIGQCLTFKNRWHDHKKSLLNGKHQNKFLLNDFKKCFEELGHNDFLEFHVLEVMEGSSKEERNQKEEEWIAKFWDKQQTCYNFKQKTEGKKRSCYSNTPEETSKLISSNMKAIWQDDSKNNKRLETIRSEAYRQKQSQKMKEKWLDVVYAEHQKVVANEANRQPSSDRMKEKWANDSEYREKMTEVNKKLGPKRQALWDALSEERKASIIEKRRASTIRTLANHHRQIQSPDGVVYDVFNARAFCKEHCLNPSLLSEVFHGKRSHHKGWKLFQDNQQ